MVKDSALISISASMMNSNKCVKQSAVGWYIETVVCHGLKVRHALQACEYVFSMPHIVDLLEDILETELGRIMLCIHDEQVIAQALKFHSILK